MTIYICANAEMLCMFVAEETDAEIADEAVSAGLRAIEARLPDADVELNSTFRDWNGGRMVQFYKTCGWVAIPRDAAGTEIEAAAWEANDEINKALEACV